MVAVETPLLVSARRGGSGQQGFTIVELLISSAVLLIFLGSVLGVLGSSLRAHRAAEEQSLRLQEVEAVVQLVNYEVSLAGYRGTVAPRSLGGEDARSISVELGDGESDVIRIRFFEDPDFLNTSVDDGARHVEYRVAARELVREVVGSGVAEVLVGGVESMIVDAFVSRDLQEFDPDELTINDYGLPIDPVSLAPLDLAGVRVTVTFSGPGGTYWTFLVGLYNSQSVRVVQ